MVIILKPLKNHWMPSNKKTYILNFMAQLLHPTVVVDADFFPAPQIFWDRLIQLGSSQLVLPAINESLKRKKLINHAPKDLVYYLQEITDLNQKRNTAILKQIDLISKVFNMHQIDHVFLKGAAMLITEPYAAVSHRMVGDIDILVYEKEILKAQQLLLDEGFEELSDEFSLTKDIFSENSQRHLKRIVHPNYIAAVEIHRRLLQKENHLITTKDVLNNKIMYKQKHWSPSKEHLWQHAILNWQYNNRGMIRNDLGFRTLMDVLYLESTDLIEKLGISNRATKHFYSLLSFYYDNYKNYYPEKKLVYKWRLKSRTFNKFHIFFNEFLTFFFSRTSLFFSSKTYRKRVFNNPKLLWQIILNFWNKY